MIAAIAGALIVQHAHAESPTTQPMREQLIRALNEDAAALASLPLDTDITDQKARQELGDKVIPIALQAIATIDQLPADCHGNDMASMKTTWLPFLLVFDHQPTVQQIKQDAQGQGEDAVLARVSLALADRILAGKDQHKADAAAERLIKEAKESPADDSAALALLQLREDNFLSAATKTEAAAVLAKSPSRIGFTLRYAASIAATQPAK